MRVLGRARRTVRAQGWRIACAVVLAALLGSWPGGVAWAQFDDADVPRGYSLRGDLRLQVRGYVAGDGRNTYSALSLQEGGALRFRGYLWRPGLLQFELAGDLFGLHYLEKLQLRHGLTGGLGATVGLLPHSKFPLTLHAQRHVAVLGASGLPGFALSTNQFGAIWRFAMPRLPRLFLRAQETSMWLNSTGVVPWQLTGPTRGQDWQGRQREASATLDYGMGGTNVGGTYTIEERTDFAAGTEETQAPDSRAVLQSAHLRAQTIVNKNLQLQASTFGSINDFYRLESAYEIRKFALYTSGIYTPTERLTGVARYSFFGDSLTDEKSNSLLGDIHWSARDYAGMRAQLFFDHASSSVSPAQTLRVREGATVGAYASGRLAKAQAHIEDRITVGGVQVMPGQSGLLLGNSLQAQANWAFGRLGQFGLHGGITNLYDLSSLGSDQDDIRLGGQWMTFLPRGSRLSLQGNLLNGRTFDRRFNRGALTRGANAMGQISTNPFQRLNTTFVLGYDATSTSYSYELAQGWYTASSVSAAIVESLVFQADLSGRLSTRHAYTTLTLRGGAQLRWFVRSFDLSAVYYVDADDRVGKPVLRHQFWLTAKRSIDLGF